MTRRRLTARAETWPVRGVFTISRGSRTEVEVVTVEIAAEGAVGRGEGTPYARYDEHVAGVLDQIEEQRPAIEDGLDRADLQERLPPGAARNALDCALWDLEAKITGVPVWRRAGLTAPQPFVTAYTLSLNTPEAMAQAARANARRPLLKVKLGGGGVRERLTAIRAAAPTARLIIDANEAWSADQLVALGSDLARLGVAMIEQPLAAGADAVLAEIDRPVPICADESCHDSATLAGLAGRYDMINIKLDKTGGLSEALRLAAAAETAGFGIMVGCMVATSLAMAPAALLAPKARFLDLDGPLILARDREPGLRFGADSTVAPASPALWG